MVYFEFIFNFTSMNFPPMSSYKEVFVSFDAKFNWPVKFEPLQLELNTSI